MIDPRIEMLESALEARRAELSRAFHATSAASRDVVPSEGGWSVAMVIEHLAQTEGAIAKVLSATIGNVEGRSLSEPFDAEAFSRYLEMPAFVDRTRKLRGSQPTGQMTSGAAWEALEASRRALREVLGRGVGLRLEDLRREHPTGVVLDGYQWIAFVGLHETRHAAQIAEIAGRLARPGDLGTGDARRTALEPEIVIRPFEEEDMPEVWDLWASCEGVGFGPGDTHPGTTQFLRRNPGQSLVAVMDRRIVAAVLCGHDGRRGFLYHLAVAPECRHRGLGTELVRRCLETLRERGIERCSLVVYATNSDARSFWETVGGNLRSDLVMYQLGTKGP